MSREAHVRFCEIPGARLQRAIHPTKRLDQWAYLQGVCLEFRRRGTPTDNGLMEAFNCRLVPNA